MCFISPGRRRPETKPVTRKAKGRLARNIRPHLVRSVLFLLFSIIITHNVHWGHPILTHRMYIFPLSCHLPLSPKAPRLKQFPMRNNAILFSSPAVYIIAQRRGIIVQRVLRDRDLVPDGNLARRQMPSALGIGGRFVAFVAVAL